MCHHQFVVEFVGFVPDRLAVVMRLAVNGSLQSLLYKTAVASNTDLAPSRLAAFSDWSGRGDGAVEARGDGVGGLAELEYASVARDLAVVRMALEAAQGLQHLHSEGVIHRDVAARNVLVDEHLRVTLTSD